MKNNKHLRIRELCKEKGVKQSELAECIGVNETSFSTSLKNETFNVEKLVKIADYLNVSISELFCDRLRVDVNLEYQGERKTLTEKDLIELFKRKS